MIIRISESEINCNIKKDNHYKGMGELFRYEALKVSRIYVARLHSSTKNHREIFMFLLDK